VKVTDCFGIFKRSWDRLAIFQMLAPPIIEFCAVTLPMNRLIEFAPP
jgi:hypothetical protein